MATELPSSKEEKKALAAEILPLARERGIKLPPTDARALGIVGRAMLNIAPGDGTIAERTLSELEEARGLQAGAKRARAAAESAGEEDEDGGSAKKKKQRAETATCENEANVPVHDALKELASLFFEEAKVSSNKKFAAMGLSKLCKFIRRIPEPITSGKEVREWIAANEEDPKATRACGPKQIKRIDEILASPDNTFADLVAKREEMDNAEE